MKEKIEEALEFTLFYLQCLLHLQRKAYRNDLLWRNY